MNLFRWMIFSSIIVFLSIGVLLTIFNTRNAYKPIKQLMNYSQSLRNGEVLPNNDSEINIIKNSMHYLSMEKWRLGNFINQVEPTLREWFFQQVLEGKTVFDQSFYRECGDYNIPVHCNYVLMVINMGDLGEVKRFSDEDKPIISFAIKNIILRTSRNLTPLFIKSN